MQAEGGFHGGGRALGLSPQGGEIGRMGGAAGRVPQGREDYGREALPARLDRGLISVVLSHGPPFRAAYAFEHEQNMNKRRGQEAWDGTNLSQCGEGGKAC